MLFALFFSMLALFPAVDCLAQNRKAEKTRMEKGIQTFKINISKLQEGISIQQDLIDSSAEEEQSLLAELEQLDDKLQKQLGKLHAFEQDMEEQEKLIKRKTDDMHTAEQAKQTVQEHLQKRIKAFYKMGRITVANVAFSSDNLPKMLRFRDSFESLLAYDTNLIRHYRKTIVLLQQSKDTLTLEKSILNDFIQQAREKQKRINLTMQEKNNLLRQIITQKELHHQAITEMEKAARRLSVSLDDLKEKNSLFDQGFLLDKGQHPTPVQGEVMTLFGQQRVNRLGIKGQSTGITIATSGINPVKAIFEGEVRYANYLRGYGNTIIIDHGFQYFSVISRLERLLTKKGDKVSQGETIGLTGDTATLMDEGIYLEIRHGSQPLDPLQWITKDKLTFSAETKTSNDNVKDIQ
jgi:septal ring factor EnvC (AmiA/AmiB activator)